MAEGGTQPGKGSGAPAGVPGAGVPRVDWRAIWPVPALGLSLALLGGGVVLGVMRAPKADPAAPLKEASALIDEREYEKAIALLNDRALAALQTGKLSKEQAQEFFLLRARAVFAGQAALGIKKVENYRFVIDDYRGAEKQGAVLALPDQSDLTEAMIEVGDTAKALEMARALPDEEAARRDAVLRRVIEHHLSSKEPAESVLTLLNELAESPKIDVDGKGWALARQTELRIAAKQYDDAINRLLRTVPRLEGLSSARRGELMHLLGRAYYEAGQMASASKQLDVAEQLLDPGDPVRADNLVLHGRVLQGSSRLDEARDRFAMVRERFADSPATLPAMLGLAETSAALNDDDGAIKAYEELLAGVAKKLVHRDVTPALIGQSLLDRHTDRATSGAFTVALKYAQLAERAFRAAGPETPAPVLLALAETSRRLAEITLEEARASEAGRLPIDQISPEVQSEVKRFLLDAGGYFREHARQVLVMNKDQYAQSLWNAADCFDLAGDYPSAKDAFQTYTRDAADDDTRRIEAKYRLAQVYQAERDYGTAASLYRQLVEARGAGSGPIGDRSVVPLASCYLHDDNPDNDAVAEELLRTVLASGTIEPASELYRDAVVELGELMHRQGRHPEAIRSLEEAVQRYADYERIDVLRYKLADANRQSAEQILADLNESMPQDRREELERLRAERLSAAGQGYQRVLSGIGARDPRKLTSMDRLAERNSVFYLADVAFEQGDMARAINLYDSARQKHAGEPASLVAMVQIVNAYVRQGKWNEAITANERARQQLAGLPENVWTSPDLPIGRKHWERWLESTHLIEQRQREQASAAGSNG